MLTLLRHAFIAAMVIPLYAASSQAATVFHATFSGIVTERYFGPAVAYDQNGDPIPDFRPENMTAEELGLTNFLAQWDPGNRLDGFLTITDDDGLLRAACSAGGFSRCNSDLQWIEGDVGTGFRVGGSDGFSDAYSLVLSTEGLGSFYYENDSCYSGILEDGTFWNNGPCWGVLLNMSIDRVDIKIPAPSLPGCEPSGGVPPKCDPPSVIPLPPTIPLLAGGLAASVLLLGWSKRRQASRLES